MCVCTLMAVVFPAVPTDASQDGSGLQGRLLWRKKIRLETRRIVLLFKRTTYCSLCRYMYDTFRGGLMDKTLGFSAGRSGVESRVEVNAR